MKTQVVLSKKNNRGGNDRFLPLAEVVRRLALQK